jgi:eukaryotic-like serine/threonine-protein kinase
MMTGGPTEAAHEDDTVVAQRYRLREVVVRRGTSTVWRAADERLGRSVVLEEIAPDAAWAPAARSAGEVHHPHLVPILEVVEDAGALWLVREDPSTHSLAELVGRYGPVPAAAAALIGAQIASGLAAVHAARIVHGALAPDVILVGDTGTGPVAALDGLGGPPVVPGSAGPADDVHALGAALREAVAGGRAGAPGAGGRLPGPLAPVLRQLTADDPAARPSAAQASTALAEVAAALAGPPAPGAGAAPSTRSPGRRRRAVLGTAAALAAVLVAGVTVVVGTTAPVVDAPAPVAAPVVPVPPVTAAQERTLDPCSLLDVAALAPFGRATVRPGYGTFSACTAVVPLAVDDVHVDLQLLNDAEAALHEIGLGARRPDVPVVVPGAADGSGCARYVLLPDSHVVSVFAVLYGSTDRPDFCAIADAAAASAVARLVGGGFAHRGSDVDRSALAPLRACALLDQEAVAVAATTAGADPTGVAVGGNAGWACDWGPVWLDFMREAAPESPEHYGDPVTIAGRPGMIRWDGDGGCRAYVPQRYFTAPDGAERAEYVRVVVEGSGDVPTLCRAAVGVAERVSRRLPAFG